MKLPVDLCDDDVDVEERIEALVHPQHADLVWRDGAGERHREEYHEVPVLHRGRRRVDQPAAKARAHAAPPSFFEAIKKRSDKHHRVE